MRGAIEVKELIFEGAEVNMVAKEDGANNWTFPTEETPEDQTTLEDLRLDDVRLTDGMISFQGAEGEAPLVLEDVDASLALQSLDSPAQLQAAFDYRGERMNIDGEIGLPRAVLEKGETPITARVRAGAARRLRSTAVQQRNRRARRRARSERVEPAAAAGLDGLADGRRRRLRRLQPDRADGARRRNHRADRRRASASTTSTPAAT